MLDYVPYGLFTRTFKELDISNNSFDHPKNVVLYKNIILYPEYVFVNPLSNFSFYFLLDNCKPFKRQDVPCSLWLYFDEVGRCKHCGKWTLQDYSNIDYKDYPVNALSLIKDHKPKIVRNQMYLCCDECFFMYKLSFLKHW